MELEEEPEVCVELQQHLQQEGLSLEASDCERLALLWRLYLEKEERVRTLTQEIQDLRAERAAEINTVQQYVENIRSLSKTRDSMALELERNNDVLRSKLEEINIQQEAQKSEIAEMLLQEGLTEVISSNLSEQVAYLLADRASLLEKLLALEAISTKDLQKCCQTSSSQGPEAQVDKVASLRGQSPWKRLLGIRRTAQTKQINPVNIGSDREENAFKEHERWLLERDLDEASRRLDMAHREIRRLTDELESARLTQRAYEPELQEAQLEVEQLRQEVEKLKRCDVAELRRAKEINGALDVEVCQLRDRVHRMQTERLQLLELIDRKIEDLDSEDDEGVQAFLHKLTKSHVTSSGSLSEHKQRKEGVHKRSCAEVEDLKQAVLKLQAELEEERMLKKKAVEECNDESKRRTEAKQLNLELQALCDHKEEVHKANVQQLHEKSQEPLLPQAKSQCKQLDEELQHVQELLKNTKKELLSQRDNNGKLKRTIAFLEQEKLKMLAELQRVLNKVMQLEETKTSQTAELQTVQLKLQMQLAQWDQDKFLLQQKQEELSSTRVQFTSMEKEIKELQQQLKDATQQLCLAEARNARNSSLEQKIQDMVEELDTLRTQVENAQKQRERLVEREKELQQQVQSLLNANTQLTHTRAEMTRVQDQQSKEQNELRQVVAKLEDRLMCSQQECENLQIQLQHTNFNLHSQISKYQDKKNRHKEKLGEAKEVYLRETAWRDEMIKEQERELRILEKKAEKESEMVKKVLAENEALLLSQRELLCQLNEEEESRKHAAAAVTAIQQRVEFLEKHSVRQWELNAIESKQTAGLEVPLQDKRCLISTEGLKKLSSFENRIIEGSEQASASERSEPFDLLAIIQKRKPRTTGEPTAQTQSHALEMDYLN